MSRKRHKDHAKKRETGGFVALPHAVLRSRDFASLSPFALKALMDLLSQYRGDNNGDMCAAWKVMAERGWRSRDSLGKALRQLREKSFIVVTRQGIAGSIARAKQRVPTLYAVTFYEIDWCGGKLEMQTPTRAHMGAWRQLPLAGNVTPLVRRAPALSVSRPPCQFSENWPAERVNTRATA